MDATPAGRLRSDGRHGKPGSPHHQEEPQIDKGDNADGNEHRNDSHRDYLHPPVQSTPIRFRVGTLSGAYQGRWPPLAGLKSCS